MILGSIYQDGQSRNSMFAEHDSVHRFNPTYSLRVLRDALTAQGIEINTCDLNADRAVSFELHIEGRALRDAPLPRYLVALENPCINTLNQDRDYLAHFRRVFTWNPRFFDLPNVTPILVPNEISWGPFKGFAERECFACLINANKRFPYRLDVDLYQERLSVIRWYERNAPQAFCLYGMGWNKPARGLGWTGQLRRRVERLRSQLFGYRPFPSYRGEVASKRETLSGCKYAYCYENVRDLSNYVTEKIIDALLAGCVPIYWGADNVADLIPADCFVDRRRFADTAALHAYLVSIDASRYARYQEAIRAFLESPAAQRFSAEAFACAISEGIADDLAVVMND